MSEAIVRLDEIGIRISNINETEIFKIEDAGWAVSVDRDGEAEIPCHYARLAVLKSLLKHGIGTRESVVACLFDIATEGGEE